MHKLILLLIIFYLSSLSLLAQRNYFDDVFDKKIAVNGASVYQMKKNRDIELISFSGVYITDDKRMIYYALDKPQTNILYFDKVNPYNNEKMHYYLLYEFYDNEIEIITNHVVLMIKNDILIMYEIDRNREDELYIPDHYDNNIEFPIAIFIDKKKYGNQYLKDLFIGDVNKYKPRYFEGKYVSEDGTSYFSLYISSGNNFQFESVNNNIKIINDIQNGMYCELFAEDKSIQISYNRDGSLIIYQIIIIIFNNDTLFVFESGGGNVYGFNGIYKKVKE